MSKLHEMTENDGLRRIEEQNGVPHVVFISAGKMIKLLSSPAWQEYKSENPTATYSISNM